MYILCYLSFVNFGSLELGLQTGFLQKKTFKLWIKPGGQWVHSLYGDIHGCIEALMIK